MYTLNTSLYIYGYVLNVGVPLYIPRHVQIGFKCRSSTVHYTVYIPRHVQICFKRRTSTVQCTSLDMYGYVLNVGVPLYVQCIYLDMYGYVLNVGVPLYIPKHVQIGSKCRSSTVHYTVYIPRHVQICFKRRTSTVQCTSLDMYRYVLNIGVALYSVHP